jgi:hypothetical protein
MPNPHGETELRKLRERISIRKHYEDAYNASALRLVPAEYPSALFAVYHVAHFGVTRVGEQVDQGHAASKPPVYDQRAMALLKREQKHLLDRSERVLLALDAIVGEAA